MSFEQKRQFLRGRYVLYYLDEFAIATKMGPAFHDRTQEGAQKDSYALEFFSWNTFIKLCQNGRYEAAFFVLPYVFLNDAVRLPCINNADRIKFIDLSFQAPCHFPYFKRTFCQNPYSKLTVFGNRI